MVAFIIKFFSVLAFLTFVVGSLAGLIMLAGKVSLRYWRESDAGLILAVLFSILVWMSMMTAIHITFSGAS